MLATPTSRGHSRGPQLAMTLSRNYELEPNKTNVTTNADTVKYALHDEIPLNLQRPSSIKHAKITRRNPLVRMVGLSSGDPGTWVYKSRVDYATGCQKRVKRRLVHPFNDVRVTHEHNLNALAPELYRAASKGWLMHDMMMRELTPYHQSDSCKGSSRQFVTTEKSCYSFCSQSRGSLWARFHGSKHVSFGCGLMLHGKQRNVGILARNIP